MAIGEVTRTFYSTTNNIQLRLFLLFFSTLFFSYTLIDLVSHPQLQSLVYDSFVGHSLLESLKLTGGLLLEPFRETAAVTKLFIFFLLALGAYILTLIAMRPFGLVDAKRKHFTTNAAHELSTPLSIIKAAAEVTQMQGEKVSHKEITEFTASVIEEVDRMSDIIKYFLYFSSINNRSQLHMSTVVMSRILDKVVRKLSQLAAERNIIVKIVDNNEVGIVRGNFTALEEMVFHLTKNAITHTPPGGTVMLSAKKIGGFIHLSVADEGDGIPPGDLPYIFDPLYRGQNAVHGGHGLGLTIVREIASMHRAHIEVGSGPQKGTVFVVKLPQ